jgi:hypothetical protein
LARTIEQYFTSDLYADLDGRRPQIKDYTKERHSWDVVGRMTMCVYAGLLRNGTRKLADSDAPSISGSD